EGLAAGAALRGGAGPALSGAPPLAADGGLLHNRHDPVQEAARWLASHGDRLRGHDGGTAVVLGLGLGYHVEALAAVWDGRIVVVEPDVSVVRTAIEARDLRALLTRVELVGESLAADAIDAWGGVVLLSHMPSLLREGDRLRALRERIAARSALRRLVLRILVVSPLGGGSHPITGYCARALADIGHLVS